MRRGRNVAIIIGCPDGCVVYQHEEWLTPLAPEDFRGRLQPVDDLAKWIETFTCGGAMYRLIIALLGLLRTAAVVLESIALVIGTVRNARMRQRVPA